MGRRIITGIDLNGKDSSASFVEEGVVVDGNLHRLLSIPLGTSAVLRTTQRFSRNRSYNETTAEFKTSIKWIYGTRDEKTGDWDYISWKDKKLFPIEVADELIYDYADAPLVKIGGGNMNNLGKLYWLEAFINAPEFPEAAVPKGIFITFEDKPFLKNACFSRKEFCNFEKAELETVPVVQYGKSINLFLKTYKMPDPSLAHHNYGVFAVTVFSEKTGAKVSKAIIYEQHATAEINTFLNTSTLNILVDLKWRDKIGHEPNKEELFYAEIEPLLATNERAVPISDLPETTEKQDAVGTLDLKTIENHQGIQGHREVRTRITAGNGDLVLLTYQERWFKDKIFPAAAEQDLGMASFYKREKFETLKMKQRFKVIYSSEEEILIERNDKVGNQMVSIEDTKYECTLVDLPCKFLAIHIKDPGRTDTLAIFEQKENGEVVDHTESIVGIVVKGEEATNMVITLEDLEHAATPADCISVGRYHGNEYDVFGMTDEIARSQMLKEGDVSFSADELTLSITYIYNKTFDTQVQAWLRNRGPIGKWANEKINDLWILRYFTLSEEQAQPYYIPISTCRFPDQTVKINAYPEINWGITFSLGLTDPKYKEDWRSGLTAKKKKLITAEKKAWQEALQRSNSLNPADAVSEEKEKAKRDLKFKLSAKSSYDTQEVDLAPGFVDQLGNYLYALAVAKNFIDEVTGNSVSEAEQKTIYQNRVRGLARKHGAKWLGKLARAPVTIMVKTPQFAIGVAWGRKPMPTRTGFGAPVATDIFIKADPLFGINGELDLITCATFIPVAGQIIKVADIVLNVVGVEPVFKLTASGKIALSGTGTVHADENQVNSAIDVHVDADIKLKVEASITVKAGLVGFMFAGGDVSGLIADNTYMAFAETGFEADFGLGYNWGRGPYIDAQLSFSGLVAVGKQESKIKKLGSSEEELFRYTIVKPKKPMIGDTYYFNG